MIEKKLIHFNSDATYQDQKSNIKDTSIVFVDDSKKIVTHGTEYQFMGWSVLEYKPITFKISDFNDNILATYEASSSMTWRQFINSDYYNTIEENTGDRFFTISSDGKVQFGILYQEPFEGYWFEYHQMYYANYANYADVLPDDYITETTYII